MFVIANGRKISVNFDTCPGLFIAIDYETYDGEEGQPMGLGKTQEEAIADLQSQMED